MKDRVIRDITNLFEHEEEDYYKPVRVSNLWSSIYVEYESYGDRNKHYQLDNILIKIDPYLKDIINGIKKSDIWKIQLTIAIYLMSSRDKNEEHAMHSKNAIIEFMVYDNAEEVIKEHFESLLKRYQIGLETPMRGSDFIFIVFIYCIANVTE